MAGWTSWTNEQAGVTVAALVKERAGVPWTVAKRHVETGKVFVNGARAERVDERLAAGAVVELRMSAPRPADPAREGVLVYDDAHVVVIDKPAGVNSVPYEPRETGTAMDLIRGAWRRQSGRSQPASAVPLHIVHRIDRATSGLLMFGKSKRSEIELAAQLRDHSCERTYLCVAHGQVASQRLESELVADRGDGLRGSGRRGQRGKASVTHVEAREPLRGATLCVVKLETGRTHQIRIHLSEAGHPLVGEDVYDRDFRNSGAVALPSPRLLLHAATLGFRHPITGVWVALESPLPPDFTAVLERLRR
ncbi:MAG TPA: RluA family pseudouridine synthase [Kofleriaceae bacterium]|mgnify:CR=1 FL=1|nr:RluA family pseudouridine synthase [Kofleriaceae bacterium]